MSMPFTKSLVYMGQKVDQSSLRSVQPDLLVWNRATNCRRTISDAVVRCLSAGGVPRWFYSNTNRDTHSLCSRLLRSRPTRHHAPVIGFFFRGEISDRVDRRSNCRPSRCSSLPRFLETAEGVTPISRPAWAKDPAWTDRTNATRPVVKDDDRARFLRNEGKIRMWD